MVLSDFSLLCISCSLHASQAKVEKKEVYMRVEMGNYFHFSRVNSELQPRPSAHSSSDAKKAV